jgi:acetyltransferase-like isoleucine patch superfamily enzyme
VSSLVPRPLRRLIALAATVLPWALKRALLVRCCGFDLDPSARIGLALVLVDRVTMGPHSSIGAFTVCKGFDQLTLDEHAVIGRLNWISGYPRDGAAFAHVSDRDPSLHVHRHAAITHRHIVDCTDRVDVLPFATLAGYRSQLLTHSIDLVGGRQHCRPISIGAYTFVGTGCIVLGGAVLADRCVLAAGSVLTRSVAPQPAKVLSGVPAEAVRDVDVEGWAYFSRERGYVD